MSFFLWPNLSKL